MPLADFVHLRTHTAYSLSAGAIKIGELAQLCRAEAMPAVAITDSGNLFGALEFATACADSGIQPIIGVEIALAPVEINGAKNGARKLPMQVLDKPVEVLATREFLVGVHKNEVFGVDLRNGRRARGFVQVVENIDVAR